MSRISHLPTPLIGLTVIALMLLGCTTLGIFPTNPPPTIAPPGRTPSSQSPVSLGHRTKTRGCVIINALPDAACTPGAIIAGATPAQICKPGYSSNVRDVPVAEKDQVYAEYGIKHHSPGEYEVDHLISLELGGSNDISNLWPEAADPRPGFHEKDQVENYLHQEMCDSTITLHDAQILIAQNWYAVYTSSVVGNNPPPTVGGSSAPPPAAGNTVIPPIGATSAPVGSGRYVASITAIHYYYCVTDEGWHKLKNTLIWSNDPSVFTAKGLTLHKPCQ